jgi:GMP synthase (glutamine-hydrolysing)
MEITRVLVVQHEDDAPAGWFGDALQSSGCLLTVATPYAGGPLPGLDGYDGLVVLGGAMAAWEDESAPWLPATRELVRQGERDGVPVLGVCRGHQIAALALGGQAGRNPAGRTASIQPLGWLPEAADDPVFGPARTADRALHWNTDVVLSLPEGARVLARSKDGAVQAARLGRHVWGIQSHPEVDAKIVDDWRILDWEAADEDERVEMVALVEEVRGEEQALRDMWWPLAKAFAAQVREGLRTR